MQGCKAWEGVGSPFKPYLAGIIELLLQRLVGGGKALPGPRLGGLKCNEQSDVALWRDGALPGLYVEWSVASFLHVACPHLRCLRTFSFCYKDSLASKLVTGSRCG